MGIRQARLIAFLLVGTIAVLGLLSVLWLGPDTSFVVARDHDGRTQFSLTTGHTAVLYTGYAALLSLVFDRIWRLRRWKRNIVRAGGAFAMGWIGGLTLILTSDIIAWVQALGRPVDRDAAFTAVVAMLVLLKANLIPKSRPAWLNGTTLPVFAWNPAVWRHVHRFSAMRLLAIGLSLLVLAILHPPWLDIRSVTVWLLTAEVSLASAHGLWLSLHRPAAAQS